MSLKGKDGNNALTSVTIQDIYEAYLDESHQTESEFTYSQFLTYYYSVVGSYSTKTATQIAYSSTVDVCYYFTQYMYYLEQGTSAGEVAYKIIDSKTKNYGGVAAGAGVIYQMLDSDSNGELDTAYIITNYHVAYIDTYCNDENYTLYYNST